MMRVISQDGMTDVPYEGTVFRIDSMYPNEIWAMQSIEMKGLMAQYSSKEKALLAMEKLRDTYLSRMEVSGGYDHVNQCYVQPNYWVLPKVFQFPADEEVGV